MSLQGSPTIERPFREWRAEDVAKWLTTLSLSKDYSRQFNDNVITGEALLKLTPGSLDNMGISDAGDRVKILQQITTMKADLVSAPSRSSSSTRRMRSPLRPRRFSEVTRPQYRGHSPLPSRHTSSSFNLDRSLSPVKSSTLSGPLNLHRHSSNSFTTEFESPSSSRMSSPIKFSARSSPLDPQLQFILEAGEEPSRGSTVLRNHDKRLSRSVDGFLQELGDYYPAFGLERHDSGSSRLVQILREENLTLKRELETYYQRVRKLQKLEHEVEKVRETCRNLEATTARKGKIEIAMRGRLEQELRKAKEVNIKQKVELQTLRKQEHTGLSKEPGHYPKEKRELKRRDTMIRHLIQQNCDATATREKLEQDLLSTKVALKKTMDDRRGSVDRGEEDSVPDGPKMHPELEAKASNMYTESIEKLRAVLSAMQNMSEKRGRLEKRVRKQLEAEIQKLKGDGDGKDTEKCGEDELRQKIEEQEIKIAALEADVAKWEHKCLELVAEKQMALETAIIPRDTRISLLECSLAEKEDTLQDLRQQRTKYSNQLTESSRKIVELETRMSSLQSTVRDKESLLQMLEQSFLDSEDCPEDQLSYLSQASPMLSRKHRAGGQTRPNIPGPISMPSHIVLGEVPARYPSSSSSSSSGLKRQELTNGIHHMNGRIASPPKQQQQQQQLEPVLQLPPYPSSPTKFNFNLPHNPVVTGVGPVPLHSSSAPNTPRIRSKPKTSAYARLALATDLNVSSAPSSVVSSPHIPKRLKSRTPPPNYKISQSRTTIREREKRHSVDGLLDDSDSASNSQNSSIELFEALIGHGIGNGHDAAPSGSPAVWSNYRHQHSKSSPSNSHKIQL